MESGACNDLLEGDADTRRRPRLSRLEYLANCIESFTREGDVSDAEFQLQTENHKSSHMEPSGRRVRHTSRVHYSLE